jgi:hypothetical protein
MAILTPPGRRAETDQSSSRLFVQTFLHGLRLRSLGRSRWIPPNVFAIWWSLRPRWRRDHQALRLPYAGHEHYTNAPRSESGRVLPRCSLLRSPYCCYGIKTTVSSDAEQAVSL